MKKFTILLIMCMAVVTTLYAQVTWMPKAGASFANVAFSDDIKDGWGGSNSDFGSKLGLVLGVAAEIPLGGEMFALQPELLFHQKGYHFEYNDATSGEEYSEDYNYSLFYLELPVLAKVKFGNFYVAAGPSIGYGLFGMYKGSYTWLGETTDDDGKVKFGNEPDNYEGDDEYVDNALDFGVQLGVGYKISVIVIDLRYGIGLTNLYDQPAGSDVDVKSQNRSIQLTIGYPIGGK